MAYTFKHGDRPLEGFTIQRAVGRGGFGEVYYALSDGGREVALKYLYDNPQIELRGVSHCINLKSPHLVSIFDVKKTGDGDYVIIMEYCSGPSLRDLLIAEPKGFGPQKAAFFVREIAKGLAYLHDRGIVHRDLKPGNIFYDDGYVKIGDYGLSKFISVSRHSAQTASIGTVHYMAPEIGSGDYSRGVDIYALGVILYEMLLGKVPFEGSSMAEILMKHLTAQPELDQLPAPFGAVIRKALAKDPKDRYQTADEMIGELLEVESIQQSLAGFSPQSLEGAIRRGETVTIQSPHPSPNPPPPAAGGVPGRIGAPLPGRLAKRMNRISHKLDQKIAKLGGRRLQPPPALRDVAPAPAAEATQPFLTQTDRRKRVVLACMLAIGLAIGLGVLVGASSEDAEFGIAATLFIVALSGAIFLAQKMIGWFGVQYGPTWAQRSIRVACGAPLLGIPVIPLSESNIATGPESAAVWLGLLAVTTFARWDRRLERAAYGEMSLGSAIWTAFGALVATAIAGGILGVDPEEIIFLSAGVAGVASLAIQAIFWARTAPLAPTPPPVAPHTPYRDDLHGEAAPPPPLPAYSPVATPAYSGEPAGPGLAGTAAGEMPYPPARWLVTRAFWSVVAFVLAGGTIFMILLASIHGTLHHDERTGVIIGSIASGCLMLFALRKTSPQRRDGFWRETLRPLMISASLFGIGATIKGITEWGHCVADDEAAGLITGLVLCALLFFGLWRFTGRGSRSPAPAPNAPSGADPHQEPPA